MSWERVKLSKLLSQMKETVIINSSFDYKLVTISNKGDIKQRTIVKGFDIVNQKMFKCWGGKFIYSRLSIHNGAFGLVPNGLDGALLTSEMPIFSINDNILPEFLVCSLQLPSVRFQMEQLTKGIGRTRIKEKEFLNIEINLPSVPIQKRIISIVENIKNVRLNLLLEQTHQIDLIKKLRQQILKDAIQGKLVPQNPDDKPASELLKKIKAEKERLIKEKKIKKEKPLVPISEDELPFTIPKNWEWCRLGEVVNLARGRFSVRPRNDSSYFNGKYPFIQIGSLDEKGSTIYDSNQTLNERGKSVSKEFPKETIVIAIVGGTIGNLGVLGTNMCFTDSIIGIYPNKLYNQKFVLNYLRFAQPEIKMAAYQMAGQPNIKIPTLTERIFPLPPLAEQQRIVEHVDELMDLCNKLEESIIRNQEITERLYQSALKEALQPKETKKITLLPNYCDVPKRTILAGYILNQCHTEDFGRVKFMKLLYLVEHICYLDFNSQYIKKAAGPYDENLIKEIEQKLSQMQFYQIQQDKKDNKRVHYTRLGCADELDSLFASNFTKEKDIVDGLLAKFKKSRWDQCEIIATLYAVWNNRIIQNELINDALLKQDFLGWDKNKAKYKDRLDAALDWMRNNNIIPDGYGKLIEKL